MRCFFFLLLALCLLFTLSNCEEAEHSNERGLDEPGAGYEDVSEKPHMLMMRAGNYFILEFDINHYLHPTERLKLLVNGIKHWEGDTSTGSLSFWRWHPTNLTLELWLENHEENKTRFLTSTAVGVDLIWTIREFYAYHWNIRKQYNVGISLVRDFADVYFVQPPASVQFLPIRNFTLVNPIASELKLQHHPIFEHFKVWAGPFDPDYLVDWLGIRTLPMYDCMFLFSYDYSANVPSRSFCCEALHLQRQHVERVSNRTIKPPMNIPIVGMDPVVVGTIPVVDEEYWEWIDCLESVVNAGEQYTVIELGARFATWAVRCAAAHRQLHPNGKIKAIAVENDPNTCGWMVDHSKLNNIPLQALCRSADEPLLISLLSGEHQNDMHDSEAGDEDEEDSSSSSSNNNDAESMGIANGTETLSSKKRSSKHRGVAASPLLVDLLDVDIQGFEIDLLSDEWVMNLVDKQVKRMHIGTHSPEIHDVLKGRYLARGWKVIHELPYSIAMPECDSVAVAGIVFEKGCHTQTQYGPVYVRDGVLSIINPNLM